MKKLLIFLFVFCILNTDTTFAMQPVSTDITFGYSTNHQGLSFMKAFNDTALNDTTFKDKNYLGKIIYSQMETAPSAPKKSYIDILEVGSDHQNKGIGSELFIRSLEDMQSRNITIVRWYAVNDSVSFYKKFGARSRCVSIYDPSDADMEFDFTRDGNPRIRFNKRNER